MTKETIWQRLSGQTAPISGGIVFACLLGMLTIWLTRGALGPWIASSGLLLLLSLVVTTQTRIQRFIVPNALAIAGLALACLSGGLAGASASALLWPILGSLALGQSVRAGLVASVSSLLALTAFSVMIGPSSLALSAQTATSAQSGIFAFGVCGALALAAAMKARMTRQSSANKQQSLAFASAVSQAQLDRDSAVIDAKQARMEALHRAQFMAEMSHEIRTPLNAILGFADTMREGVLGPMPTVYNDYPQLIHASGTHLLDLISDLLDLSKIDAGRFETSLKPISLDTLVYDGVRMSSGAARGAGVQIRHAAGPPIQILGDSRAVRQMVFNLLSNAIKFTPRDGRVTVRTSVDPDNKTAAFEVEDTGDGISPQDLARIGEPWNQVSSDDIRDAKRPRGSGLGLALVKRLAHLQGGQFELSSSVGVGSVARVTLPLAQVTAREVTAETKPDDTAKPPA